MHRRSLESYQSSVEFRSFLFHATENTAKESFEDVDFEGKGGEKLSSAGSWAGVFDSPILECWID